MSYDAAKNNFGENKALIGDPMNKPLEWNLANGLQNLTHALQADIQELQQMVAHLSRQIADLKKSK